jgi:hypothetical protein
MNHKNEIQSVPSASHLQSESEANSPPPEEPASGKIGATLSRHIATALSEWVTGISPPQDPPFARGTRFPDSEWNHFFRVFSVSTALSGTVFAGHAIATKNFGVPIPSTESLKALVMFAFFGLIYSLYSRLFGVAISLRQSLFCLALVITPWLPIYLLLKALGASLGAMWLFLAVGLAIYVLGLIARAIHMVTGVPPLRVVLSLLFGLVLAIFAAMTRVAS